MDKWKNRRWMAWASMTSGLLFPLLVLWTDSPQVSAIAPHFYLFVGGIVGCYMGFATLDDKWSKKDD